MLEGIDNVVAALDRSPSVNLAWRVWCFKLVCWGNYAAVMWEPFLVADACGAAVG